MAPLDYSMAAIVHQQLIGKQVGLMLEDGVSRFGGDFWRRDRSFEKWEANPGGYGFIEYRCPSGNPIGQGSGTYDRSTRRYRCQ